MVHERSAKRRMNEGLRISSAVILALLVGVFIARNEIGARREARDQIKQHASVISEAVWTLDRDGARDYLQLAIQNGHYEELVVTTSDGEPFYSGSGTPLETTLDRLLGAVDLIPIVSMRADVTRGGVVIGAIDASARLKTVYADLYALVLGLLLFLAGRLYGDLLGANRDLDNKVQERTKQLTESYVRLGTVEEDERRNINRELHDRVGQNLSALQLSLGTLRLELDKAGLPAMHPRLDDAQSLLEETSHQMRDVMAELRPAALDDFGLFAALRHHAGLLATRLGIPITVEGVDIGPRLPPATETALFRIVQEALNNATKHAQARNVKVMLVSTPNQVRISVVDDGCGFDAARPAPGPSYGLTTMRERAEAVGARLHIDSSPGEGTRVEIEVNRRPA